MISANSDHLAKRPSGADLMTTTTTTRQHHTYTRTHTHTQVHTNTHIHTHTPLYAQTEHTRLRKKTKQQTTHDLEIEGDRCPAYPNKIGIVQHVV